MCFTSVISTNKLRADRRFLLRIPHDLHDRLKSDAATLGVSLNEHCVRTLRAAIGAEAQGAVPQDSARTEANASLAADHVARAEIRVLVLDVLLEAESWADVVRESQEVVELAVRGLLRWAGVAVPPGRDAARWLQVARKRLPAAISDDVAVLAEASRRLRRDRDLAFYGSDDLVPWDFYGRADAERARDTARAAVGAVRRHVLGQG